MNDKKDFKLNNNARKKINEQYYNEPSRYSPPRRRPRANNIPQQPVPPGKVRQAPRQSATQKRGRPVPQQPAPPQRVRPVQQRPPRARERYVPEEEYVEEIAKPRKKHPRLKRFIVKTIVFCLIVILANIAFLYYRGHLWFNEPRKRDYPVRGAVVDSELGAVDWEVMSTQTISFVYIRATKGTAFVDEQYSANRKGVNKTKLLSGYYHDYDFRTDGVKQAENFINSLGDLDGRLRPMVRVTKYGIYNLHMKEKEKVRENLQAFLDRMEEEYGRRCVIMCDNSCYEEYIREDFSKYTLWLMGHFREPDEEDTHWALWEYNPRVRSTGYENNKKYYAMSVYRKEKDIESFKKNFML